MPVHSTQEKIDLVLDTTRNAAGGAIFGAISGGIATSGGFTTLDTYKNEVNNMQTKIDTLDGLIPHITSADDIAILHQTIAGYTAMVTERDKDIATLSHHQSVEWFAITGAGLVLGALATVAVHRLRHHRNKAGINKTNTHLLSTKTA